MRSLRYVVLGLALVSPAIGHAEVWQDRVLECPPLPEGAVALTSSSRILYVNDCLPNGCRVLSGTDSSITDSSTIADGTVTMSGYGHGQAHWDEVIACVRETFAPFNIEVVTENPGTTPHFEVMAAGTSRELNTGITGAGGIAPFISCNAARDNLLSFVFAGQTSDKGYLCAAIAHEAGHTYGLSHSLNALDPMTYMDLGSKKVWQNADQVCGTETPQNCRCFDSTQNSFRYLQETFGLAPGLADSVLTVATPREGMWVRPGFPVRASYASPLTMLSATMAFDNGTQIAAGNGVLAWNAPAAVDSGDHRVTVAVTDFADRVSSETINVHIMSSCAAGEGCGDGFHCLGGYCLPGAGVAGGLGASCTTNDECTTSACASDGTSSVCTGTCDAGNVCPSGYECLADANLCWPTESGGCAVAGGSPGTLLAALGAVLVGLRRRRRHC